MDANGDQSEETDESRGLSEEERRGSGRVEISADVTLKSVENLTAAGSDLSVGGIYVVTEQELPIGSLVDIEFSVEGIDRDFELLGEVRWRQRQPVGDEVRCGLGLKFLNLRPVERKALQTFVEERAPIEPSERIDDLETDE